MKIEIFLRVGEAHVERDCPCPCGCDQGGGNGAGQGAGAKRGTAGDGSQKEGGEEG